MTKNTFKLNSNHLFLCMIVSGLVVFCLSLALVYFRQHIMRHGYSIGNLERACFSYEQKISELDREILSMGTRNKIIGRAERGTWKPRSAAVVHVSKNDIQRYALASGKHVDAVVAKNFSLEQTKITR
jgi:cell division protein FtsL